MQQFHVWQHKKNSSALYVLLFFVLLLVSSLVACSNVSVSGDSSKSIVSDSLVGVPLAASPSSQQVQSCPAPVGNPAYWNRIVGTQPGITKVEDVSCATIVGNSSLQALVTVRHTGTHALLDAYVYTAITASSPTRLFSLQGLYDGEAKLSHYNTVISAEVNQKSASPLGSRPNLFREFKWADAAGTLVPTTFPGFYPDMSRYQAENDQAWVQAGHDGWKNDAISVAKGVAKEFLHWSNSAQVTLISGGSVHDVSAILTVKSADAGAGTIQVTLSRLEGNTVHIWEAVTVTSTQIAINAIENQNHSPATVTGTGNAFEGEIGSLVMLDSTYNNIGQTNVMASNNPSNGRVSFSAVIAFDASFRGAKWQQLSGTGPQEGLVILYATNNAGGPPATAVIVKQLLGN